MRGFGWWLHVEYVILASLCFGETSCGIVFPFFHPKTWMMRAQDSWSPTAIICWRQSLLSLPLLKDIRATTAPFQLSMFQTGLQGFLNRAGKVRRILSRESAEGECFAVHEEEGSTPHKDHGEAFLTFIHHIGRCAPSVQGGGSSEGSDSSENKMFTSNLHSFKTSLPA